LYFQNYKFWHKLFILETQIVALTYQMIIKSTCIPPLFRQGRKFASISGGAEKYSIFCCSTIYSFVWYVIFIFKNRKYDNIFMILWWCKNDKIIPPFLNVVVQVLIILHRSIYFFDLTDQVNMVNNRRRGWIDWLDLVQVDFSTKNDPFYLNQSGHWIEAI